MPCCLPQLNNQAFASKPPPVHRESYDSLVFFIENISDLFVLLNNPTNRSKMDVRISLSWSPTDFFVYPYTVPVYSTIDIDTRPHTRLHNVIGHTNTFDNACWLNEPVCISNVGSFKLVRFHLARADEAILWRNTDYVLAVQEPMPKTKIIAINLCRLTWEINC